MRAYVQLFTICLIATCCTSFAQTFTDTNAQTQGLSCGALAWGDIDGDGDLDLVTAGCPTGCTAVWDLGLTKVYRNNSGILTPINTGIVNVRDASLAWGDFDNDGDLDLAICGLISCDSSGLVTKVYRNDGNGTFVDTNAGISGMYGGRITWVDYDNDGRLDLSLFGRFIYGTQGGCKLYHNDGNGVFREVSVPFECVSLCGVAWADYDKDGDQDIALAGWTNSGTAVQKIYRNDGNGSFTDTKASLPNYYNGNLQWGDYDNDGDLDLVISGVTGHSVAAPKVYRNDGGTFVDSGITLPVLSGSAAWGDYDNDGRLDLLLAGSTGSGYATKVYRNQGGSFVDSGFVLASVAGPLVWGDYNGDGRLDIAAMGQVDQYSSAIVLKIYRGTGGPIDTRPSVPVGLSSTASGSNVTFKWIAASDAETPAAGLSYNLRVGSQPGSDNIFCSMSDPSSGQRRIPDIGNAGSGLSWVLRLPRGTYYWSVQAVDSAFEGSEWGPEQLLTLDTVKISGSVRDISGATLSNVQMSSDDGLVASTDSNGYYELWVSRGWNGKITPSKSGFMFTPDSRQYSDLRADTTGQDFSAVRTFTPVTGTAFQTFDSCTGTLVDLDNDGKLDVLLTGQMGSSPNLVNATRAYHNDGSAHYTQMDTGLENLNLGNFAFGDYDSDGDLDLATSQGSVTKIFRNDGNGHFAEVPGAVIGLSSSCLAWGDWDNDGDQDLAVIGSYVNSYGSYSNVTRMYRNDAGTFSDSGVQLWSLTSGLLKWVDVDKDGDLDLTITGCTGSTSPNQYFGIYRNGTSNITTSNVVQVNDATFDWGDYDGDGDLDLAVCGDSGSVRKCWVYRNDGGTLIDVTDALGIKYGFTGQVSWADYDNDGRLDLAITTRYGSTYTSKIYHNDGAVFSEVQYPFPDITSGTFVWGECDGDGRLDLLHTAYTYGYNGSTQSMTVTIYHNNCPVANTPPLCPTGPATTANIRDITCSWTAAVDAQTPSTGLSYDLRIGTSPGGQDIMSGMADSGSGALRMPAAGNIGERSSWKIRVPCAGAYYWSVQAVDSGFVSSGWAPEQSIEVRAKKISGYVRTTNGLGLSGTSLVLSTGGSYTTDATGYYEFWVNQGWSGSITASKLRYQFSPGSRAYSNLDSDRTDEVFVGTGGFSESDHFPLGASYRAAAWADYDGDGDLDLVVGGDGSRSVAVFRNDSGAFVQVATLSLTFDAASLAWADYDGDGDVDLAVSGSSDITPAQSTSLFRNDGGTLVDSGVRLDGICGPMAWGDYDNDGHLDLAIGKRVLRSINGSLVDTGFSATTIGVPKVAAWADYDNDGDIDLVVGGTTGAKLYRNDHGTLVDSGASFAINQYGSLAWADYDNDGDLDLAATGWGSSSGYATKIYRNDHGTFVDTNVALVALHYSSVSWADYDNDGWPDLVVAGQSASNRVASLYHNNRDGTFTDANVGLSGMYPSVLAWADFDKDGDLDLLAMGDGVPGYVVKLYRNDTAVANTVPQPPTGLSVSSSGSNATFVWNASSDSQTPGLGLSYNLRVGTSPGASDVYAGMADAGGGRLVVGYGNSQKRTSWSLGKLSNGTYYWSVQSIDTAFAGSAWADEQTATVAGIEISGLVRTSDGRSIAGAVLSASNGGDTVITASDGSYSLVVSVGWTGSVSLVLPGYYLDHSLTSYSNVTTDQANQDFIVTPFFKNVDNPLTGTPGSAAWGDYDNDGWLDLVTAPTSGGPIRLYHNLSGELREVQNSGLPTVQYAQLAWGDYNRDGKLDLAVSAPSGSSYFTRIYRNKGDGTFVDAVAGLPDVYGSIAWGDYDNDGDLDLAVSGSGVGTVSKVFRNDGGHFINIRASIVKYTGAMAWCDVDRDGDLDLIFISSSGSRLYRNDAGVFTELGAGLPALSGYVSVGDYDSDGDPDIAVSSSVSNLTTIYRNNGTGSFAPIAGIAGCPGGSFAWGDFDNDGDLDFAVGGNGALKMYRNDSGTFTDTGALVDAINAGTLAWSDFDNDGRLDLTVVGTNGSGGGVARLYRGLAPTANSAPSAPLSPACSVQGVDVTLSWLPGTDQLTQPSGLSYNVRVGTKPGSDDVLAGHSSPDTGVRRVAAMGNVQSGLSWKLRSLPRGTYYWSVQSIDTSFAGSPWAAEGNFSLVGAKISGCIVGSDGKGYAGVLLTAGNGGGTASTDSSGNYELPVPVGWSGTVTPSSLASWFIPDHKSYINVITDLSREDYSGGLVFADATSILSGTGRYPIRVDYDGDGWLDLALADYSSSNYFTRLYHNENGRLAGTAIALPLAGRNCWADYDNDGDLDCVVFGNTGNSSSYAYGRIYRNDGGTFSDINAGLFGQYLASVAWGDYDNDGRPDLAVCGSDAYACGAYTRIYHNNGNGTFTLVSTPGIIGASSGQVGWADYDNDGDLDLTVCGTNCFRLYQNNASSFTDAGGAFKDCGCVAFAWGDYDSDGDLDIAVGGWNHSSDIYRNDSGVFTKISASLGYASDASLAWADYDNDGDLDLAIAGSSGSHIFRNDRGVFVDSDVSLPPLDGAGLCWGDNDNDGDADLVIAGGGAAAGYTRLLYRNDWPIANTRPTAPSGLSTTVSGSSATFAWARATDAESPPTGLCYNIRVGSRTRADDVVSGLSDPISGARRIVSTGNIGKALAWTLKGLSPGVYYWSIQSIDTAFIGSPWATEHRFAVGTIPISSAKLVDDGASVTCGAAVVTAVFGDSFYVETDDRSSGIRVNMPGHGLVVGMRADVAGRMQTSVDGERYISAEIVAANGLGSVAPLMLTNKDLGGGPSSYDPSTGAGQRGVEDGSGLSNTGLLVKTTGRVTGIGDDFFYVDDGTHATDSSIFIGVRIICQDGTQKPVLDQQVAVTGVSCINYLRERYFRCVRPRSSDDIQILSH